MAGTLSSSLQVLGGLLVFAGCALLGVAIGMLEKAREEATDGCVAKVDSRLVGAATALAGAGSALLSVGWL